MARISLENQLMLKFVDATVASTGEIKAKDIATAFNVCKNTSIRILKLYKEALPGNLRLIEQGKYAKTSVFKAKFLGQTTPTDYFHQLEAIRSPFKFITSDQAPDWCYQTNC
ncbi:hypothetical protein OH460_07425 [Vibrio sp. Makdt]|uniref:hypothetical protein n=1 Tax=Vibrio sp. Makdt TaxID=2998828 RepID=UPI0022CD5BEB|nr:hypothetical protein [Vibrio sp. Makdt]MDA0152127.1 hypothetical protein [Vibrio sp. Makdt]